MVESSGMLMAATAILPRSVKKSLCFEALGRRASGKSASCIRAWLQPCRTIRKLKRASAPEKNVQEFQI
jgi:hypothetical protein